MEFWFAHSADDVPLQCEREMCCDDWLFSYDLMTYCIYIYMMYCILLLLPLVIHCSNVSRISIRSADDGRWGGRVDLGRRKLRAQERERRCTI